MSDAPDLLAQLGPAVASRVESPSYAALRRRAVRRRRRRRAGSALGAVLVVAAAGTALIHRDADRTRFATTVESPRPDPTPSAHHTSPSPSTAPHTAQPGVLADPKAHVVDVQMLDDSHGVALWRTCGENGAGPCRTAIVLTRDGFGSAVVRELVGDPGSTWTWTHLLPDGSVAVVPDGLSPFLLRPDGTTSDLTVSLSPAPASAAGILVGAPPAPGASASALDEVWVLDPTHRSLHPLATQPLAGARPLTVQPAPDGSVYVMLADAPSGAVRVTVARTTDRGATWTTSRVPMTATTRPAMPGYLAAGPDGRVAVVTGYDGATLLPFAELWTSADHGRTWQLQHPARHPDTVAGMAYAPDGSLLMAGDGPRPLWRAAPGSASFTSPTGAPSADSLSVSGGVLVARSGARTVALSADGRTWRRVVPAAP